MKTLIDQILDTMLEYVHEASVAFMCYDTEGAEAAIEKFSVAHEVIERYHNEQQLSWAQKKVYQKIMHLRDKMESNKKLLDDIDNDMEWIRVNCCK